MAVPDGTFNSVISEKVLRLVDFSDIYTQGLIDR